MYINRTYAQTVFLSVLGKNLLLQRDECNQIDSLVSPALLTVWLLLNRSGLRMSRKSGSHYENLPMQYTEIFLTLKIENFQLKIFDSFLIFAQNIDCGYMLEPPRRGGSNEYPQSMFWSKNKKNRYTPAYPSFTI